MRNPFRTPLASAVNTASPKELGHPEEGFTPPNSVELNSANYPDFHGSVNSPLPYHGSTGERFQAANPGYAGSSHPTILNEPGLQPSFSQLAPAPGSENLIAPRNATERPGTNRLYQSHGPVSGGAASPGWTGKATKLRTPVVGNSGPVSGGRDNSQVASQAYWAAQAAQLSQSYSDAAMVSAL